MQTKIKRRKYERHGMWGSSDYETWRNMRRRCSDPKIRYYYNYGGRGIKVCQRWENSFVNFMKDMGPRPSKKHTLDRIDSDGNYEPKNCRWVLRSIQNHNQRQRKNGSSVFRGVTKKGKKYLAQISARKKRIYLGLFESEIQAALAYNKKAIELYKDDAMLNTFENGKGGN